MCLASHIHWQGSSSFAESRLLHQHNIEKLSEQSTESPGVPEVEVQSKDSLPEEQAAEERKVVALNTRAELVGAEHTMLRDVIGKDQRATDAPTNVENKEGLR